MTHASLFSGIGGFDLAAEWLGWENIFQVEIDPFCQKVLAKNFPNAKRYADIKQFSGTPYAGTVDVISGGFPCQPYSVAGQRRGSDDDRALWPEMLRVIREIQPTWVVGENVPGIIQMELESVCTDLESAGYAVQPFVVPACGANALHRRDRVWVIAHSQSTVRQWAWDTWERRDGHSNTYSGNGGLSSNPIRQRWEIGRLRQDSESQQGLWGEEANEYSHGDRRHSQPDIQIWQPDNIAHLLRTAYGLPGRVDRNRRIRSLGNAIVPQVAYEFFKSIHYAHHHPT